MQTANDEQSKDELRHVLQTFLHPKILCDADGGSHADAELAQRLVERGDLRDFDQRPGHHQAQDQEVEGHAQGHDEYVGNQVPHGPEMQKTNGCVGAIGLHRQQTTTSSWNTIKEMLQFIRRQR